MDSLSDAPADVKKTEIQQDDNLTEEPCLFEDEPSGDVCADIPTPANCPEKLEPSQEPVPDSKCRDEQPVAVADVYSTENFKLRLDNVHEKSSHSQIKKRLVSLGLNPRKIKKVDRKSYAFVTFANEEDKQKAIDQLQGHIWKGKALFTKEVDNSADPFTEARKREASRDANDDATESKQPKLSLDQYKTRFLDKISPLWKLSYDDQLARKKRNMSEVMTQFKHALCSVYKEAGMPKSYYKDRVDFPNLVQDIKASPTQDGYRNKCEFTVGFHPISEELVVGFRISEYRQGSLAVMVPDEDCKIVSDTMKKVALNFEQYLKTSEWKPYDRVTYQGNWIEVLVRTSRSGEIMIQPLVCEQNLEPIDKEKIRESIKDFAESSTPVITSTYIRFVPRQARNQAEAEKPPEHVCGSETINETLLGLSFQISPTAFFQVNVPGAEVLYSSITEFSNITEETTVLDVCCGTGTIGMILSKTAKKVIGIEVVPGAVCDAERNATLNGIDNISFKCGKAEDIMPDLVSALEVEGGDVIAIVDPPRAGLHNKVTMALRRVESLKRLVYVSCEPKSAVKNFIELMRPPSNRWRGEPFELKRVLPVDMFPCTDKCELILLFERN